MVGELLRAAHATAELQSILGRLMMKSSVRPFSSIHAYLDLTDNIRHAKPTPTCLLPR